MRATHNLPCYSKTNYTTLHPTKRNPKMLPPTLPINMQPKFVNLQNTPSNLICDKQNNAYLASFPVSTPIPKKAPSGNRERGYTYPQPHSYFIQIHKQLYPYSCHQFRIYLATVNKPNCYTYQSYNINNPPTRTKA